MKLFKKDLIRFLMIALGLGISLIVLPQETQAQTEKAKAEKPDDDDDEDVTEADKASVKVSLVDARKIALERIPGKVTDQELEKENGRLQYAFDILTAEGKSFDVEIDAMTGEVLQAEEEENDCDGDAKAQKSAHPTKAKTEKTAKLIKIKPLQ